MRLPYRSGEEAAVWAPAGSRKKRLSERLGACYAYCVEVEGVMADRDISVNELSEKVGRSAVNLSHLRCNRSKGIRISLLEDLCRELHCQPGDLLVYEPPAREEQD